jgi:hypothetical protein
MNEHVSKYTSFPGNRSLVNLTFRFLSAVILSFEKCLWGWSGGLRRLEVVEGGVGRRGWVERVVEQIPPEEVELADAATPPLLAHTFALDSSLTLP